MLAVDESSMSTNHAVQKFYDSLAPQYDAMTGFAKRFEKEGPAIAALVERYGIKRALDAGSGSGFHSIVLARLGVDVTALDLSPKMVRLTEEHARLYKVEVRTFIGAFRDIPVEWRSSYDGVLVMGNSLPHLLSHNELAEALRSVISVLRPGGTLVIQCLNYERILNRRERILNTKDLNGVIMTREYDYDSDGIRFSIVTKEAGQGGGSETRETVRLRPVLKDELVSLLEELGVRPESFGNIFLETYYPSTSSDLVVVAAKQ